MGIVVLGLGMYAASLTGWVLRLEDGHRGAGAGDVRGEPHGVGAALRLLWPSGVPAAADAHLPHAAPLARPDRGVLLQDCAARHAAGLGHRHALHDLPLLVGPRR